MNDRKLDKAVILMDKSDLSVADNCFICGSESMTTFINDTEPKIEMVSGGHSQKEKS